MVITVMRVLTKQAHYIVRAPPRGDEFIYTPPTFKTEPQNARFAIFAALLFACSDNFH